MVVGVVAFVGDIDVVEEDAEDADAGGLATWVSALDNGEALENIEAGFAGSEEFKAIIGE